MAKKIALDNTFVIRNIYKATQLIGIKGILDSSISAHQLSSLAGNDFDDQQSLKDIVLNQGQSAASNRCCDDNGFSIPKW